MAAEAVTPNADQGNRSASIDEHSCRLLKTGGKPKVGSASMAAPLMLERRMAERKARVGAAMCARYPSPRCKSGA